MNWTRSNIYCRSHLNDICYKLGAVMPYHLHNEARCSIPILQTSPLYNTKVAHFHLLDYDNSFLHWRVLERSEGFFYVSEVPGDKKYPWMFFRVRFFCGSYLGVVYHVHIMLLVLTALLRNKLVSIMNWTNRSRGVWNDGTLALLLTNLSPQKGLQ